MNRPAFAPREAEIPFAPFEALLRLADARGIVFFDSALPERGSPQFSLLACNPVEILAGRSDADWEALEAALGRYSRGGSIGCGYPDGFAAGYVAYDGSFRFGFYEDLLAFDHASGHWRATGGLPGFRAPAAPARMPAPRFERHLSEHAFRAMVVRAKEYITAGDIYQVNLSHRLSARWEGDPLAFYGSLRQSSPAPHAAYIDLGAEKILSTSPELFLRMRGSHVRTRPIKGTRPRRSDPEADERSACELITSGKELAELVMITDLERNDLGAVCSYGSVSVPELLRIERHAQVFHLVSTVEGELRENVSHVAALRSCFPGGSITGAPKKRAREIIAELEPEPRGIYTGALGYFGFNGESQFNIAIRTVVIEGPAAHFHVGAGIVAESTPEKEFAETMDKAAGILLAAERLAARP